MQAKLQERVGRQVSRGPSPTKQTRKASLVESISNVIVGYGINLIAQIVVFSGFGIHVTFEQNIEIGLVFTVISIARSFVLRRVFEVLRVRGLLPIVALVVFASMAHAQECKKGECFDEHRGCFVCK